MVEMSYIKKALPAVVKDILKLGNKHGEMYLVGGAVRDILLHKKPKDYDFATNMSYDTLKDVFKGYEYKEIGKAFGIFMVMINGEQYEIAQFRKDIGIPTSRQRQEIELTSNYSEDIARRDFTVNSFMYREGEIKCSINAQTDLKNMELRLIGNKKERIQADPLRILRAFRFMATKGFKIEKETFKVILELHEEIGRISQERVRDELLKIITSENNLIETFDKMYESGILKIILPELHDTFGYDQRSKYHTYDLAHHLLYAVKHVPYCEKEVRVAMLFHDIAKQDVVHLDEDGEAHYFGHDIASAKKCKIILTRLKFSSDFIKLSCSLIRFHMMRFNDFGNKAIRKMITELTRPKLELLFDVWIADETAHSNIDKDGVKRAFEKIDKIINFVNSKENITIKTLNLNGHDLLEAGFKGKEIGIMLKKLTNLVVEKKIENKKEILLNKAINYDMNKEEE